MPLKMQFPAFEEKFLLLLLSDSSVTVLSQLLPFILTSKVMVIQITCSFCLLSYQSLLLEEINMMWVFLMEFVTIVMISACC